MNKLLKLSTLNHKMDNFDEIIDKVFVMITPFLVMKGDLTHVLILPILYVGQMIIKYIINKIKSYFETVRKNLDKTNQISLICYLKI